MGSVRDQLLALVGDKTPMQSNTRTTQTATRNTQTAASTQVNTWIGGESAHTDSLGAARQRQQERQEQINAARRNAGTAHTETLSAARERALAHPDIDLDTKIGILEREKTELISKNAADQAEKDRYTQTRNASDYSAQASKITERMQETSRALQEVEKRIDELRSKRNRQRAAGLETGAQGGGNATVDAGMQEAGSRYQDAVQRVQRLITQLENQEKLLDSMYATYEKNPTEDLYNRYANIYNLYARTYESYEKAMQAAEDAEKAVQRRYDSLAAYASTRTGQQTDDETAHGMSASYQAQRATQWAQKYGTMSWAGLTDAYQKLEQAGRGTRRTALEQTAIDDEKRWLKNFIDAKGLQLVGAYDAQGIWTPDAATDDMDEMIRALEMTRAGSTGEQRADLTAQIEWLKEYKNAEQGQGGYIDMALQQLSRLNAQIQQAQASGADTTALRIERDTLEKQLEQAWHGVYGDPNWLKYFTTSAVHGLTTVANAGYKTLAALERNIAPEGVQGPLQGLAEMNNEELRNAEEKMRRASQAMGYEGGWTTGSDILSSTAAAIPDALLAVLTAGASTTATGAALTARSAGVGAQIANSVKSIAKNPQYWTSFVREFGPTYYDAIDRGESDETALATATISALSNAFVEIGLSGTSGFQGLPEKLIAGNESAVLEWVKSSLEEGGEEVVQGAISRLTQKALSGDLEWEGPGGVADFEAAIQEFGLGAAVGMLIGGGQIGVNAAYNGIIQKMNDSDIGRSLRSMAENSQEKWKLNSILYDVAVNMPEGSKSRNLAMQLGEEGFAQISNAQLGAVYKEMMQQAAVQADTDGNTKTPEAASDGPAAQPGGRETAAEPEVSSPTVVQPETATQAGQETENDGILLPTAESGNVTLPTAEQAEQNTPVQTDGGTAVDTDPAEHTAAEQQVIEAYKNAVDEKLVEFVENSAANKGKNTGRYELEPVSARAAADIQALTGVDATGFRTVLEQRMAEHIVRDHGPNGKTDHSMADVNDIGRMQYVIDHYDTIEYGGTSNAYSTNKGNGWSRQADTVLFSKAVNGTYYVVEAVPDTKAKTTFVVSAYMSKNGAKMPGASKTTDANAPAQTAKTDSMITPDHSNVPQTQPTVNTNPNTKNDGILLPTAESGNVTLPTAEQETAEQTETRADAQPAQQEAVLEMTLPTGNETALEQTARLYGVPQATVEQVRRIADILGRKIAFYRSARESENGYYDRATDTLYLNARSRNPVAQIIAHELTHSLEKTDAYANFRDLILNHIQERTGESLDNLRKQKRAEYLENGVSLKDDPAVDYELVAEYTEKNLLTSEEAIRKLVQQDRGLGQRILDWLNTLLAKLGSREAQRQVFLKNARDLYAATLQESQNTQTSARTQADNAARNPESAQDGSLSAGQQTDTDDVYQRTMDMIQFSFGGKQRGKSLKNVDKQEHAAQQNENLSIREQLREHQNELNHMEPVAQINGEGVRNAVPGFLRNSIIEHLRPTGFKVNRQGFGEIIFDEKRLNTSLNYLDNDADAIAYQAIPQVLKRGKELPGHRNHKDRNYSTVTIAAPIIINEKLCNMAVIVKRTGKNYYKMHRVLTPDGKLLNISKKETQSLHPAGGVTVSGSLATPISSAFDSMVAQPNGTVKRESEEIPEARLPGEKQYSISRTPEQAQESMENLRRYMDGETRTQDSGNAGEPVNLQTYAQSEAQKIVETAHGQGLSVEEYLQQNRELYEYDGQWSEEAKAALELDGLGGEPANTQPATIIEKETSAAIAENPSPGTNRNTASVSGDSITEESGAVNGQEDALPEARLPGEKQYSVSRTPEQAQESMENLRRYMDGETRTQDSGRPTPAEIRTVQTIDRKSVNDFSSEEVAKTDGFARKYWREMGIKSPFFRAWFGDWRANDQTPVEVADQKGAERGLQHNVDTGWDINVSGKVFNESRVHHDSYNRAATPYLAYINDIVRKAVLLDSYTMGAGKTKSANSLLMHSMYAVADNGNGPELVKLYVEEMNDPNSHDTAKRAYQLQNVEKYRPTAKSSQQAASSISAGADIRTVAELFAAVKRMDHNFNPKRPSAVTDEDGHPMAVYHGTNEDSSEFGPEMDAYWFSGAEDYAKIMTEEQNSNRVLATYLNMKDPLRVTLPMEYFADGQTVATYIQQAKEDGYDGVIFDTEADTFYAAFQPGQFKSATDNIGTFDGENPDIRYSISRTLEQAQESMENLRRYADGETRTSDSGNAGEPVNLQTYAQSEAQKIVETAHGQGLSVVEYLRQNRELYANDQTMFDTARLALELEKDQEPAGRQYSISRTDDGRAVAVVDSDILSHIDTTAWDQTKKAQAKKAAKTALLAFKDGVQVNGITYKVNKISRDEFTRSNDMERLYRKEPAVFADKLRASANADDIITATTSWANDGKLTHPRTDKLVDFAHGEVLIQAGSNRYQAETVVGITDTGEYVFYDVVNMEPTNFKVKEEPSTAAAGKNAESAIQESSSGDSITEESGVVNGQEDALPEAWLPGDKQYSISRTLEDDLNRVLEGRFLAKRSEIYIGETSNFLTDKIGAEALRVTMPANKAYSAMVTEEQAKQDGRFQEHVNYHGLGVQGLMDTLEASENPVAAFAADSDEHGKRRNSIVLVTHIQGKGGPMLVVEAVGEHTIFRGNRIDANKVITSYSRNQAANDIIQAGINRRLLYLDKKRSQTLLAGVPGSNSLAAIREADFKNNIRDFWAEVNWEKMSNDEMQWDAETGETARQYSINRTLDSFLDELTEGTLDGERQRRTTQADVERLRQQDLDDYFEMVRQAADVLEPRTRPEDHVSDAVERKNQSFAEKAQDAWSYVKRKLVDSGEAVERIGKAVKDRTLYPYYNMARASSNAATSMILDRRTDVMGQDAGKGLNQLMEPIREKGADYYKKFQLYLFHLHNIDRMSRYSQGTVDAAQAALEEFRMQNPELNRYADYQLEQMARDETSALYFEAGAYIALRDAMRQAEHTKNKPVFGFDVTAADSKAIADRLLRENPEFDGLAQEVYAYIDNLLRYRVDSGLITEEDYAKLKSIYPHYVPTYRVFERTSEDTRAKNSVQIGSTIRKATGGTQRLMPLHKALAQQTMSVVREGSKNRFGQRLLHSGAQGTPGASAHVRNITEYKSDFSENTFDQDTDALLRRKNTFVVRDGGKLWEMEVSPALFEAVEALSPAAAENNVIVRLIRKGNNLFKELVTGYNPTFLVRNFMRDLQDAGLYSKDTSAFIKQYPLAVAEIAKNGKYWQQYKALGGTFSTLFDYETGETRQGRARRDADGNLLYDRRGNVKHRQNILNRIETLNMAVEQAPRLAEFMATVKKAEKKNGNVTMDDLMEAMYNAADITVNFGRSGTLGKMLNANFVPFLNPGIQGFDKMVRNVTETKGVKNWLRLVLKSAVLGVAPGLINALLYRDEPDWDDLKDRDKDINYLFKVGDTIWLKLPKGRTLSLIGMSADRIAGLLRGEKVDWAAYIDTALSQSAPANPLENNILQAWFDTKLFDPENPGETWYGTDIENQRLQGYEPGQRYDTKTDAISKWLGQTFNLSPKKINYLLDQYSGVIGDVLLPLLTPSAQKDLFSAAFTIDSNTSNRFSEDFYGTLDALTYAKNAAGADGVDDIVYRYFNKQSGAISEVNAAIREIEADSQLSNAEKRELLKTQYAIRNGIMEAALNTYGDFTDAAEKYYLQSDATDESDRIEEAYRMANREILGAEYALETYSKSVYQKAQKLQSAGVDYETFYDFYFDALGMKDSEKYNLLAGKDYSDVEKQALAGDIMGTDMTTESGNPSQYAKLVQILDSGLDMDGYLSLREMDGVDEYLDALDAGLDSDAALDMARALGDLEPEYGEDSVSVLQKQRAVIDAGLTVQEQLTALESISSESEYKKFRTAHTFGVEPDAYVCAKEILPQFDKPNANGNYGTYTQAEIEEALDALGTGTNGILLPTAGRTSVTLTNDQKAVLWQLLTGSSSAKNNPYSTSIGWDVLDAYKAS